MDDFIDNERILVYDFIMNENGWKSRWSFDQLRAMLLEQFDAFWERESGIQRSALATVEKAVSLPHAVIIFGLRRVGKSTLLLQIAHKIGKNNFYYLNFEDDRFINFRAEDMDDLYQLFVEFFGVRKIFIFDEIQNVKGWEHFVRRFMDLGHKFYISGSNASLLSKDLGTLLTGRYVPIELFPFSFQEYLQFNNQAIPDLMRMKTSDQAQLKHALGEYLIRGGIPDALKYPEIPLTRTLYDDILYRDIAARLRIDSIESLKQLAFFLISNPGAIISYNKLKERFKLGSVNTISSYIALMENSWLFLVINRYAFSVKRQLVLPKKIYSIDTGMAETVGFHFSPNTGKLLENLVFLTLRRKTSEIYYYATAGDYEVDFFLPEEGLLIQVAQNLEKDGTREREFRALAATAKELRVEKAIILTDHNENDVVVEQLPVQILSVSEWLLSV